jgi:hypothetical protein
MKKRLLLLVLGGMVQPALADTREDVKAAMQRCDALADDRAWLDCTYGAEQSMRAKLGLAPAPEYQQRLVPPVGAMASPAMPYTDVGTRKAAPLPRRKASFFQILTGSAPPLAVSPLASFRYDSQGAFLVTLQNGQVWHQLDPDFSTKPQLKVGAKVIITPGALGSYNLKAGEDGHVYKVEPRT